MVPTRERSERGSQELGSVFLFLSDFMSSVAMTKSSSLDSHGSYLDYLLNFIFLAVLENELRSLCLLGRNSNT
jgi:hypothetical protein